MTDAKISDTNPIYYEDATALAALIRTRQLSSREVVQVHLDRISVVNPQINAVVTLMAEDALKGADIADKAVADGAALGPLHGVPFSIKDSLDTAGVLNQRQPSASCFHNAAPVARSSAQTVPEASLMNRTSPARASPP